MVRCEYGFPFRLFFFLQSFIQGLVPRYPELFEGESGDSSQHQINFGRKWRGYQSIATIAGEDLLKFDEVLTKPLEECLLFLAYLNDKNLLENLIHKEAMAKIK
jgi:hypothetical protein